MKIFKRLSLFALFIKVAICYGQNNADFPVIGKRCPEFILKEVRNYPSSLVSLSDLEGKYFILDFFSAGCVSCFASLPKTKNLQEQFKDSPIIIMVGKEGGNVREMYQKFEQKLGLNLPVTFDSALPKHLGISGYPYQLWVDNAGIVKAVTTVTDVTAESVEAFIHGKGFAFKDFSKNGIESRARRFNNGIPFLSDTNINWRKEILFRSQLTKWQTDSDPEAQASISLYPENNLGGIFQCVGVDLGTLCNYAILGVPHDALEFNYYGKIYQFPVMENVDDSLFVYDYREGKGLYNYSLVVPDEKAARQYMQDVLKKDLERCFGITVSIERRKVPCWFMRVNSKAINTLKTKNEKLDSSVWRSDGVAGFSFRNSNINGLINMLRGYHYFDQPPIIDQTNLNFNIDLTVDAMLTDFYDFKAALEKKGILLVKGETDMMAIVVKPAR